MTTAAQPLVLARATHVRAFTDVLGQMGVPLQSRYRRFGLPDVSGLDPDCYLPVPQALRFLQSVEYAEGIEDLGFITARSGHLRRLNRSFVEAFSSAPYLYGRLIEFSRAVHVENTHLRVSLSREGERIRISDNLECRGHLPGLRCSEWLQIIVLIELVRQSVSSDWQPEEITFRSRFKPADIVREAFPRTRIRVAQQRTSITVPTTLLQCARLALPPETSNAQGDSASERGKMDFVDSLKTALRAYVRAGYPDVELIAELAGTSVRTLQRRLSRRRLSYATLVREIRCEIAAELLRNTDMKLFEVAYDIGYSDPSNFGRAFRSVTGVGPEEFRRRHRDRPHPVR